MIRIWTERLPEPFHFDPRHPVRGTERFYVETAKHWGDSVTVYYDGPEVQISHNVRFAPRSTGLDRHMDLVCNDYERAGSTFWTNFADFRVQKDRHRGGRNAHIVISQYANERAGGGHVIVPHGIDRDVFFPPVAVGGHPPKRERLCVVTSSPDRGGDALAQVWPSVEKQTGYRLWRSPYPGRGGTPVSQQVIADKLRAAKFWLHPGIGEELFCLAAVEAQACGAVPIIVPNGALHETVKWGFRFNTESFVLGVLQSCAAFDGMPLHADADHIPTWAAATAALRKVVDCGEE